MLNLANVPDMLLSVGQCSCMFTRSNAHILCIFRIPCWSTLKLILKTVFRAISSVVNYNDFIKVWSTISCCSLCDFIKFVSIIIHALYKWTYLYYCFMLSENENICSIFSRFLFMKMVFLLLFHAFCIWTWYLQYCLMFSACENDIPVMVSSCLCYKKHETSMSSACSLETAHILYALA